MELKSFVFNPFYENTYVLSSESKNAFIFDPGCYENFELDEIKAYIAEKELKVKAIINTHCHIDHVLGNDMLKLEYKAPLWIPQNEKVVLDSVVAYAPNWGITRYSPAQVDEFLIEENAITLDEVVFDLIEVPGHSPGHMMFYEKQRQIIIGGDVLFRESIGRTDLPGGNHDDLINNIKNKVYTLPDETVVYPGHGPETTIGYEKLNNPFVRP